MNTGLQLLAVFALIGCLVAAYFFTRGHKSKPRILPPPRSKSTERSYEETNSVAKLFLEIISLKESAANWPSVLKGLNTQDEPRIRTLLLELRSFDSSSARQALEAIEAVCIESKHESEKLTRAELLQRAQLRLQTPQP